MKSADWLETATTAPEEYGLLSALVANPRDQDRKLVYADWLEERGDRRASYVRDLAAAARSLGKKRLPDPGDFPRAWSNMLGAQLLAGILEFDLVGVQDAVLQVARPAIVFTTEKDPDSSLPPGGSRLGGQPDLPAGVEWPVCSAGPLGFLGQVALRDLQGTQAAHALPKDGLLSVFAFQDFVEGYQPGMGDHPGDVRVLYTPGSAALVPRQPPPELDLEATGILPVCRLLGHESWDLPHPEDILPPEYAPALAQLQEGGYETSGKLHELRQKCSPWNLHRLLGYSIHSRTSDPAPGPDWVPLLCLESDDNLGWNWCDGEHLAFWVQQDDLRGGNFARVFGYAS
jgi:uncharacterized protein (TIGR02996 family)